MGNNSTQPAKKKVLIVDEEETIRFIISETLGPIGCEIDTTENAEIALQKIESKKYDLIITDYAVPKSSGFELAQKINKTAPSLPVLVFATNGCCGEMLESETLAYQKKPFNLPELLALSQVILASAGFSF